MYPRNDYEHVHPWYDVVRVRDVEPGDTVGIPGPVIESVEIADNLVRYHYRRTEQELLDGAVACTIWMEGESPICRVKR